MTHPYDFPPLVVLLGIFVVVIVWGVWIDWRERHQ